ncbi:MAG: CvpA family protein [Lachnospiraceae bacterium]|nr:CvpA family protein [Lachnospiraceae bacterium]
MNLLLIIVLVLLLIKMADGYRKGMVKEIISLISLLIMCVVVTLIGAGLYSYMQKKVVGILVTVLLLTLVGIAHHFLKLVFFSAKVITKLPIIHAGDKWLGMLLGAVEVVVMLWTMYTFTMYFELGMIGQMILDYTEQSKVLTVVYEYNLLAPIVSNVVVELANRK